MALLAEHLAADAQDLVLTIGDCPTHVRGTSALTADVAVSLTNSIPITGVQFDVSSSCVTIDSVWVNPERKSRNHNFEYNGNRVLISSATNQPLRGDSGAIAFIRFTIPKLHSGSGNYRIYLKNIILTEPDETQHSISNVSKGNNFMYIVGDANADGAVDAADYVVTANKIMERNVSTYYGDAADVNNDGTVNVVDLVGINNFTLGRRTIEYRNQ